MQSWFTFEWDGEPCRVEQASIHQTLADFLYDKDVALTGTSGGTGPGSLVIMGEREGAGHRFRVFDARLLPLPLVANRQVWTARGIREIEPDHPANLALQEGHLECGDESWARLRVLLFEGYYRPDLRRHGQIHDQFDGITSVTANTPAIRQAATEVFSSTATLRHEAARKAERAGDEATVWTGRKDIFHDRFTKALFRLGEAPGVTYVDGRKHRWHRPTSLTALLKLRREIPEAPLLAGGTTLAGTAAFAETANVISLESVKELHQLQVAETHWDLGAALPLTQIAEQIGRECPPFNKSLRHFGERAVRNRATLGGYLATAWMSGQLTPLLLSLNSRVLLLSEAGERDAPLSQFFLESGGTILQPGEVIRCVRVPRSTESVLAARGISSRICDSYSVGPRRNLCTPYVSTAFALELREAIITKAWVAGNGIGPAPFRVREAEEFLTGQPWSEKTAIATLPILNDALARVFPASANGRQAYQRQLLVTLFQKFYHQHPTPRSVRSEILTSTEEFAKLDEPFFRADIS